MTSDALYNYVSSNKSEHDSVVHNIKMLRMTIDRVAKKLAKENAAWHDDPEAEDHAAYHAPAEEQFPREVRDEAIRELMEFYLAEFTIQEGNNT